ncbi:MAG: hypothetical protein EA408_13685 [Marinilabiliales bacterium]|nr:MAG: hypothetical protein EA408_13685 [Marinilabiliales bacterium]
MKKKAQRSCRTGRRAAWLSLPVFLFIAFIPLSGNENYPLGSRPAAMGNAFVAVGDIWSVQHNQAGLAGLRSFQAAFHHENRFLVPEFGLQAVAAALPFRPGTIGVSYTYFGFTKYYESKLGLAFGRGFGERFSAGLQVNYLHTYIAGDYGYAGNVTVEGGFIAEPVDGLFVAAHIYNPTRATRYTYYGEPLPTVLRFGVSGYLSESLLAAAEAEKDLDNRMVLKGGLEMGLFESLWLRTGIISDPVQPSFGIGYGFGGLVADIAFTGHQVLGLTPHFSLSYIF